MLRSFPLRYSRLNRDNGYTPEEDRYLLWLCKEVGFGEWRKMRRRVEKDDEFGLDYFLLSRTDVEVDRRVNVLLREVQRFNDPDYKGRAKAKGKKKEEEKKEGGIGGGGEDAKIKAALAAAAAEVKKESSAVGVAGAKRKSDTAAESSVAKRKR